MMNASFKFDWVNSILASILLTMLFNLFASDGNAASANKHWCSSQVELVRCHPADNVCEIVFKDGSSTLGYAQGVKP